MPSISPDIKRFALHSYEKICFITKARDLKLRNKKQLSRPSLDLTHCFRYQRTLYFPECAIFQG